MLSALLVLSHHIIFAIAKKQEGKHKSFLKEDIPDVMEHLDSAGRMFYYDSLKNTQTPISRSIIDAQAKVMPKLSFYVQEFKSHSTDNPNLKLEE